MGRYGDICNILPLWKYMADQGDEIHALTNAGHCDIYEGTSYVKPVPSAYEPYQVDAAEEWARANYDRVIRSQAFMHPASTTPGQSFCLRQWELVGKEYLPLYHKLPLVFDRRDPQREAMLVEQAGVDERPIVLMNFQGISSPFNESKALKDAICERFNDCNVIDLAQIKAQRIFDLLGLYERAAVLVTIDTATLHLAHATRTPTVALSHPQAGQESEPRDYWVGHFRYNAFCPEEITALVDRVIQADSGVHSTFS